MQMLICNQEWIQYFNDNYANVKLAHQSGKYWWLEHNACYTELYR